MKRTRGFASDNNAPVHPDIFRAMEKVNKGHVIGYGDDPYTARATEKLSALFGENVRVYFAFTGTATNVLGLSTALRSWESVICAETSHIYEDECGAPEKFTGGKLIPVEPVHGKLTPERISEQLYGFGFEHHSQPRIISITQATETGTVYTPDEIREITGLAHKNGLLVHMDGARIANAAAYLDCSFREMVTDTGVDILSFGGTKNGMMYGEAVVILNSDLDKDFKYIRKQSMQLASKMRYIAAQFEAYLEDDLWLRNARHANRMAQLLAKETSTIPGVTLVEEVQANGLFVKIPERIIKPLQEEFFFYVMEGRNPLVRWMTSWDTTEEDIHDFSSLIKEMLS
ncbi:MAG: low specificity L-threonine aldolase [Bacteroidales bacterium]|nr:low specificity L-threonine aldolase [Bacteroidales bacterium]